MLAVPSVATVWRVNRDDVDLWLFRASLLGLPFLVGPTLSDALDGAGEAFRVGVGVGAWTLWAIALIASMVPRTETLTLMRVLVPGGLAASAWSAVAADSGTGQAIVTVVSGALPFLTFRAAVQDRFVDGSSYGDERRFLLGTPGALLLGPLALVWLVIVTGALGGPLLLLAERWVFGGLALVLGMPLAVLAAQALHRLSTRWLVFVPAGVVVHDKTALREPQLFRKSDIALFGPAPADTEQRDLSLGSIGLALRAQLAEPSAVMVNERTDEPLAPTPIEGFVVSPNRPGAVVAEAKARGYTIG